MGPSPDHNDNMILDWSNNDSPNGFGHPTCKGGNPSDVIIKELSKKYPTKLYRTLNWRGSSGSPMCTCK
jgi:hypothetical protein